VFERTFRDFGLPAAIRTDNGTPFAAPWAMFGLSRLAVWWLRLGIRLQRIKPGKPQQNGRHERMHLTLKNETTKPAAFNFLQQQERFDDLLVYNRSAPGARRCLSGRGLYTFSPTLRATAGSRLPVPRPHRPRHAMRAHLPRQSKNQSEYCAG
jgi:putative transposase